MKHTESSKEFKLKNISFELEKGKILELLGPNGSGKTTLPKAISGISNFKGSIDLNQDKISFLPDTNFLYDWMKISDAFAFLRIIQIIPA